jgi:phage-related protein
MKLLDFQGRSRSDLDAFPDLARREAGYELYLVQVGGEPTDWKPMTSIGKGVREIRIHLEGEHRVIYIASFEEAVYILHCFEKKSQRTSRPDLEIASKRYADLLRLRSAR